MHLPACVCVYTPHSGVRVHARVCARASGSALGPDTFAGLRVPSEAEAPGAGAAVAAGAVPAPAVVTQEAVASALVHVCGVGVAERGEGVQRGRPAHPPAIGWARSPTHSLPVAPAS